MLIHAKNNDNALQQALSTKPAFGVRTAALIDAYGSERPFFNIWYQEKGVILSRLEESFFIYADSAENCDFEELACFLEFNPYFKRLVGEESLVKSIADCMNGDYKRNEYRLMVYKSAGHAAISHGINSEPGLSAVYNVMSEARNATFAIGNFEAWYADISHRIRHGCARAYMIEENGETASACLISAQSRFAGLISGVATKPAFRRRGYASALVLQATNDLYASGRLPVIECLEHLAGYYAELGFDEIGKILELEAV